MSSIDTNVGSPPCVSRTSCAASAASTSSPSRSIAAHCASVYGRVTRGSSWTRVTLIAKSNSTSQTSVNPMTGAALPGSAVQASGRWPSPASSPDVGSSPIQPAPGM